jgi:putative oxidoreductase
MKKLFSTRYSDNTISFALFILRLTMGGLIIPFGYDKLMNFSSKAPAFADPFHIGHSTSLGLVVFAEFFCGILVVIGLATRLASLALSISMAVAVIYAHNGEVFKEGGHAALFLGGFLTLLFSGPGKMSFDKLISK